MREEHLNSIKCNVAINILVHKRQSSDWTTSWQLSQKFIKIFPNSYRIFDEAYLAAFYTKNFSEAVNIMRVLRLLNIPNHEVQRIYHNFSFIDNYMIEQSKLQTSNIFYDFASFQYSPFILVCMNSTLKTINSFLRHCEDKYLFSNMYYLYNKDEDMKQNIPSPRFEYIKFNTSIINTLGNKCTPYIFLLKNDWLFFKSQNFLSIMRDILDLNIDNYGQVLINNKFKNDTSHTKLSLGGNRYFEAKQVDFDYTPSLINREILFEHDFQQNYKKLFISTSLIELNCIQL